MKSRNNGFITWLSALIVSALTCITAHAQFSPPFVTVPGGEQPPGAWPRTVSAANIDVNTAPGSILGGAGSDNLKVQIPNSGPFVWTESRHNEGDISFVLSPNDPAGSQPANAFVNNYAPLTGPATHGWRINKFFGLSLASVRVNGRNNGDTNSVGTPIGTVYGVAYFNADFGQGQSYQMTTGNHLNGGDGAQDMQMGLLGMANAPGASDGEGSFSCSAAFFPYVQGWVGAHVPSGSANVGPNGEANFDSFAYSPSLNPSAVTWQLNPTNGTTYDIGHARVVIPNADPSRGLLFGSGTEGDNQIRIFGAYPNNGGWNVAMRNSQDLDAAGQMLAPVDKMAFMFLYVPTNSCNFIGGHIDGATGNTIVGGGNYTLTRTAGGNYELTIPGKTGSDGALMLTVAGAMAGSPIPNLPDRTVLSYEYTGGKFVIQSREALSGGNPFGLAYNQRDTDFVFLWVDFKDPVSPAYPHGPTPTVPGGEQPPGQFPNESVSGANVDVNTTPGSTLGGAGSDNLKVQIPNSGPYVWTESRHNEGDIAFVLSPNDPVASQPANAFVNNYAPTTGPATHGWRINKFHGLSLASVRVNGRDNGDTAPGGAVGTVYGIAYLNADFGQGQSYQMTTGNYLNGGDGAQDMQMGLLGMANAPGSSDGEGSFSCGAAFFPYAQGWIGAHILSGVANIGPSGEAKFDGAAHSPLLYTNSVNWMLNPTNGQYDFGHARVVLRGAQYKPETALLFGSSTEGDNQARIFGAYPNNGGWDVTIRDGQNLDAAGQMLTSNPPNNDKIAFMFLCIPTNSPGLIGGHIDGATGSKIISAGTYTMTRTAAGNYELTIPGKTGSSGMLLLTVAGAMAGSPIPNIADRTVLSYEYTGGKFVIQSREVLSGGNPFGLAYNQRDTDFVFAWVDFTSPLATVNAPSGRPKLTIVSLGGGNVRLSWPSSDVCYGLESTTSLSPASWTAVSTTPTLDVNSNTKSLTLPSAANRYFRLKRM